MFKQAARRSGHLGHVKALDVDRQADRLNNRCARTSLPVLSSDLNELRRISKISPPLCPVADHACMYACVAWSLLPNSEAAADRYRCNGECDYQPVLRLASSVSERR